jgi:hypothetical protein
MIDALGACAEILSAAGFSTAIPTSRQDVLLFEDSTTLGFVAVYANSSELIRDWSDDVDHVVREHQLALRLAGSKAWNLYAVLLAIDAEEHRTAALAAIEEDLSGTRKIARSGMRDRLDVHEALLALLPLQSAPRLEAVDIESEIRQRAVLLPERVLDAFLSPADDAAVLQVLEEEA